MKLNEFKEKYPEKYDVLIKAIEEYNLYHDKINIDEIKEVIVESDYVEIWTKRNIYMLFLSDDDIKEYLIEWYKENQVNCGEIEEYINWDEWAEDKLIYSTRGYEYIFVDWLIGDEYIFGRIA